MRNLVTLNGHLEFTYRGQRVRRVVPDGVDPMDHLYHLMSEVRNGTGQHKQLWRTENLYCTLTSEGDQHRYKRLTWLAQGTQTRDKAEKAVATCILGKKASTANKYISMANRIWPNLNYPKMKETKPDKPVLTRAHEATIRKWIEDDQIPGSAGILMALDFLLATGLRKSEALRVTRRDLREWHRKDGTVWHAIEVTRSKGGEKVSLPITYDLYKQAVRWTSGGNLETPIIRSIDIIRLVAWMKRLNRKYSAHTLRHTYATRALEAGASIYDVSKALGHSSVMVTERNYAHVQPSEAAQRVQEAMST